MRASLSPRSVARRRAVTTISTLALLGGAAVAATPGGTSTPVETATPDVVVEAPSPAGVVAAGREVREAALEAPVDVPSAWERSEAALSAFERGQAQAIADARAQAEAAAQAAAEAEAEAEAEAAAEQAAAEEAAAEQAAAEEAAAEEAAAEEAAAEQAAAEAEPDPEPEPAPAPQRSVWDRLADCESGDWGADGQPIPGSARWDYGISYSHGDSYEGGLNFHPGTWDSYRSGDMPGHAGEASRAQQIRVAEEVLADQGWGAWPVCSDKVGIT